MKPLSKEEQKILSALRGEDRVEKPREARPEPEFHDEQAKVTVDPVAPRKMSSKDDVDTLEELL
jgi:hypothetical protein